jgi:hypothetical protein
MGLGKHTIYPTISIYLRASYEYFSMRIFVEKFNFNSNVFVSQNDCHVVNHKNLNKNNTNVKVQIQLMQEHQPLPYGLIDTP